MIKRAVFPRAAGRLLRSQRTRRPAVPVIDEQETLMPAPALPDELVEEIFLRLSPDEPAWLVRASLASKLWLGLLSGPSFCGCYRELHGAPPMLGYLYIHDREEPYLAPNFVRTTKFLPRNPDGGWRRDWYYEVLDSHHGRVLLGTDDLATPHKSHEARILLGTADENTPRALIVWDPMTGCQRELYKPQADDDYHDSCAAVLCAVSGCDHSACHEGPFLVVFVGVVGMIEPGDVCHASATVFSSETGEWSEPCSRLDLEADEPYFGFRASRVLIEGALYFKFAHGEDLGILKYDLGSDCLSLVDVPVPRLEFDSEDILMAMEDGSLGFAHRDELSLYVWSRQMACNRITSWTHNIIDLKRLSRMKDLWLMGHVEGRDIILMTAGSGVYEFDMKSRRLKKLSNKRKHLHYVIPYMSFYRRPERQLEEERQQQGLGWYVHHEFTGRHQ